MNCRAQTPIQYATITTVIALLTPTLFTSLRALGQSDTPILIESAEIAPQECGVELTPEQAQIAAYLESIGAYDPPDAQPRFVMQVPVTLHVLRRDNGTGGLSATQAEDALDAANVLWESTGIQFFPEQPVRFINNTSLFNIDNEFELTILWSTDVIQDSVNVYFVNQLTSLDGGSNCGIASFSFVPVQGVTVANGCTPSQGNSETFAHELGHYFDLYHTHETAVGIECPDGSNCNVAGDLVCDTPADPRLNIPGMLSGCSYAGTGTQCGDPYSPDPTNVMSYAGSCRNRFSYAQGVRAATTLNNIRTNLVSAGGNPSVMWVDFAAPGGGNGSYASPYNTLAAGVSNVGSGGRVVFKPGSTNETILISNPVFLDSFQGSAIVGN